MPLFSRWKTVVIWLAVVAGLLVSSLNFFSDTQLAALPGWLPTRTVTLGLDLQGGSHLMLKIERADIVQQRLQATVSAVGARLRDAGIRYTGLSGTDRQVQVRITDLNAVEPARQALLPLTEAVSSGGLFGGAFPEVTLDGTADGGMLTLTVTDKGITYHLQQALEQSIAVVLSRARETGDARPIVTRSGGDRIVVQMPGLADPERLKSLLGQVGQLSVRLVDTSVPVQQAIDGRPPSGSEVLYSMEDPPVATLVEKRALLSDRDMTDAEIATGQTSADPFVIFQASPAARTSFADAVTANADRSIAVILDGQVLSILPAGAMFSPDGGRIPGNFSAEGVNDLATMIRSGALPAALTVVEERSVDSSLGADSIYNGIVAGIIAALAVVVFMLGFYGFLGAVAIVALAVNIILIIAVLTLFGATLTLPGMAGIVLTIGMAVDSNVLIYERIREEFKAGHSIGDAIRVGFSRAFATVLDANLTTLIAAAVLFFLGSGPVRGFAVTVSIGVITTLFTAFTLSRWIIVVWVHSRKIRVMPKGVRTGIFDGTRIRFMGIRRHTLALSAFLAIAAMVGFAAFGMNLGIDFAGGSLVEVRARTGNADLADLGARLNELNLGYVEVKGFRDPQRARIRVQAQDGGENAEQSAVTLIRGELGDAYEFRRVEVVGPAVSGELTLMATLGVVVSLAAIVLYIWIRFEWQFALGAVVATLHDIILTIGLFVITGIEFNLTSIAAVLMIVGYSLNDTVVVYDRMRENLKRYKDMPLSLLIDASINQTLSRTILTSATTMLALLALCVFGGDVIRSFAITMLFGVAVGTFSSIYMAAPMLIAFGLRPEPRSAGNGRVSA